jgi:hypothetical protein
MVLNITFSDPLRFSKTVSSPDLLEIELLKFSNPFFSPDTLIPPPN